MLRTLYWANRSFEISYLGHVYDINHNQYNSKYVKQILDTEHSYGAIDDAMKIVKVMQKVV
jgi:hypothetical protein